jgi:hypothetical protein
MTPDAVIFSEIIVVTQPFEDSSFPQLTVQRVNMHFFIDGKIVEHCG